MTNYYMIKKIYNTNFIWFLLNYFFKTIFKSVKVKFTTVYKRIFFYLSYIEIVIKGLNFKV